MSPIGLSLLNPTALPTPSAILDLAKLDTNCSRMLDTVKRLGLNWRPHVKTHKTIELTRLQVGDSPTVDIIVSTVVEAEFILPLLLEYQSAGRKVLYSFPLYATVIPRLATLSKTLGPSSLSVIIDHPSQIPHLTTLTHLSTYAPLAYLKIDGAYHRAGVPLPSAAATTLISGLLASETAGDAVFHGLYVHAGHSYDARDDWAALDYLLRELTALAIGAEQVVASRPEKSLVLSVGATPTATSLQHSEISSSETPATSAAAAAVTAKMSTLKSQGFTLEVHAGVYPTLDLQQLATHARSNDLLSASDLALTILVDVASEYPGRGANGTDEFLINAGCLALGREPCKDMGPSAGVHYSGWGIPKAWPGWFQNEEPGKEFPAVHGGWQVGKISQEHGILKWMGDGEPTVKPRVGQRMRVWPNHACIAGAGFSEYLVIDSRKSEDIVVDVWKRCSGW